MNYRKRFGSKRDIEFADDMQEDLEEDLEHLSEDQTDEVLDEHEVSIK